MKGLYIHIPFCKQKCKYCDFVSFPCMEDTADKYVDALKREAEQYRGEKIDTIFIGGGTPSILTPKQIEEVTKMCFDVFDAASDCEFTTEANPGTIDDDKIKAMLNGGINRISVGVQSFNDDELKKIGRIHDAKTAYNTICHLDKMGFQNINLDIMTALPSQTFESLKNTLNTAVSLPVKHISAYSLIIEEGTPFGERKLKLPDEDTEYRMYENTAGILEEYGFHQYEISNYAKGGRECRHNKGYWQRIDYLGLGLGASSLLDHMRFSNTADMKEYIGNSAFPDKIRQNMESLTEADEMAEFMFLGLRMTEGVSMEAFAEYFGKNMENVYGEVLKKHLEIGMLEQKGDRIYLSRKGIHVSNGVMADFLL